MKARKGAAQEPDYEVGYRRPPRQHQFKKGQPSPNPKGRPRGSKAADLPSVLKEPVSIKIGGRVHKVPFIVAYFQVLKDRAIKGDLKSGRLLMDLAKQSKMLDVPDLEDDYEFTIRIGPDLPLLKQPEKKNE